VDTSIKEYLMEQICFMAINCVDSRGINSIKFISFNGKWSQQIAILLVKLNITIFAYLEETL